jgi:hypothetical protein
MTRLEIAWERSLTVADPASFMLAFHAGRSAAAQDVDSARFLRALCADGHASSAAGFLEGMAVANAEAGMPIKADDPFWRRHQLHAMRGAR